MKKEFVAVVIILAILAVYLIVSSFEVPLFGPKKITNQGSDALSALNIPKAKVIPHRTLDGRGDLNCDSLVDFADINPFVMALSNPTQYSQNYPGCDILNGDINCNGQFGFDDINPFVACLTEGACPHYEACAFCGDGIVNGDELCDGDDLNGETCQSQGYDGGILSCLPDCTDFNYLSCAFFNELSDCAIITSPGKYSLINSLFNENPEPGANGCIDVRAPNVIIDCRGNQILNTNLAMAGIYSNQRNTTIKNCKISLPYFQYHYPESYGGIGIKLIGASDSKIENSLLANNSIYGIALYSTSNITLINNTIVSNHPGQYNMGDGIYSYLSHNSSITQNLIAQNRKGIFLKASNDNNIVNNVISHNSVAGIYSEQQSNNNEITGNFFKSNFWAINPVQEADHVTQNVIEKNRYGVNIPTSALYDFTSNELNDNLEVNYDFDTSARIEDVNEQISFEFNLKDLRNNLCSDCQYSVELYPPEPNLYHSRYQSTVVGSFTPTKLGMYSLKITVTDTHNNPTVRKFVYLIGPTDLTDTQYYFRGFNPAHGQPSGISAFDVGTLTFDASTASENRYCSSWIQFSPDEIPEYPYGLYKNISYAVWYSLDSQLPVYKYIGFQKQVIYNINRDYYTSLPSTYQQGEDEIINFGEFNHVLSGMSDYPFSWYWISLKLAGGNPKLYASSRDQSNAIITHRYSTTPAIKSLDEEGIDVLSATSPTSDTRQADIFIEGTGVKQLTIEMPQEPTGEYLAKLDGQTCAADSQFCKITHTTSKELKFTLLLSSDSAHLLEIFPSEYFPYDDAEQR